MTDVQSAQHLTLSSYVSSSHSARVILELKQVTKIFRTTQGLLPIIDRLDLEARSGELVAIVGPSGCGKSSLLNMIAGLDQPSSGSISVQGCEQSRLGKVGYMLQRDLLVPWRTAVGNAASGLEIQGVPRKVARVRAKELLLRFGLAGFEDAYPHALSGGMRQRVAFARSALASGDLLLLDEPFGALDALTRLSLHRWLLDTWRSLGKTGVLVTHDPEEAILLADRVSVLSPRPAHVCFELEVDLPYPRDISITATSRFAALHAQLRAVLLEEEGPMLYGPV